MSQSEKNHKDINNKELDTDVTLASLVSELTPSPDESKGFAPEDVESNKAMSVLAYLGILVAVPLLFAKESKYARFHTQQGLILLICEVLYALIYGVIRSVLLGMSWRMGFVINALGLFCLFFFILLLMGIANAVGGKAKRLPLIGRIKLFNCFK